MRGNRAVYRFEPPPAYFVHVPKTGGVSLGSLLESAYRSSERIRMNPPRFAQLPLAELGRFRLYHAMHQGRRLLEMTGRKDLICITMVRDPIERTLSQIYYLRRIVKEVPHTFTPEYLERVRPILEASLTECLDPQAFVHACDSQTRTLGILEDYTPLFKGSPDATSGRSVVRPYPLPPLMDTGDSAQLLKNSLQWMGEMQVVGTTEKYQESVTMVCDVLGLPVPATLPRKNANPERGKHSNYRAVLPKKLLSQLEELTAHDQQLYQHACELFEQQWSRYRSQPRRIYSIAPRLRGVVFGPVAAARAALSPVKRRLKTLLQGVPR